MNDFEKKIFGKGKTPFEGIGKMSSTIERMTTPFLKTQSIIDSALKSQSELIGSMSLRTQGFYEAFQPAILAFAKFQENSISKIVAEMERANALHRASLLNSISDVLGRIQLPQLASFDNTLLKQLEFMNNDFNSHLKKIVGSELISNLHGIPEFTIPLEWEAKSYEEIYEEVGIPNSGNESNKKLIPFLVLLVAGSTGLDLSELKNPEKRKIILAQIFYFLYFVVFPQFNKESSERTDYCIVTRGCVVRVGPGYKSQRLTAVPKNYTFRILEDSNDWYKIQFIDPTLGIREGWVKKSVTSNMESKPDSILFSELKL